MNPQTTKPLPAVFLLLLLALLLIFSALSLLDHELATTTVTNFDQHIQTFAHLHSTPLLIQLMLFFTLIGSVKVFVPIVAVLAILLWTRGHRYDAAFLVLAMASAGALNTAIKHLFHRARPHVSWAIGHEDSFSFPSGHTVFSIVLYGVLAYLLLPHLRTTAARLAIVIAAVVMIFSIAGSRIVLGMHYPSDVTGGTIEGLVWLTAAILIDRRLATQPRSGDHPAASLRNR